MHLGCSCDIGVEIKTPDIVEIVDKLGNLEGWILDLYCTSKYSNRAC